MSSMPDAAAWSATRARWLAIRTDCQVLDRGLAASAVTLAYQCAGLPEPAQILWCAGPVDMQRSRMARYATGTQAGPPVRSALVDAVLCRALDSVRRALPLSQRIPIETAIGFDSECRITDLAVNDMVAEAALSCRPNLSTRLKSFRLSMIGKRRMRVGSLLSDARTPHESLSALAILSHYREAMQLTEATAPAVGLMELARQGCWIVPHRQICWVSERHRRFCVDARGRLHAADGPALAFADGTRWFVWKGVRVPAWIIEHKDLITPQAIELERSAQVRRAMIDVLTPERFVEAGGARRVSTDKVGVLWRTDWWNRDSWAAVEVVNGSPEPEGHFKHYFLQVPADVRSPTEAVAWTYGLSPRRYALLSQRT